MIRADVALTTALFLLTALNALAKCDFKVNVVPGDTLPTVAYLTPGESLHLVIEYDNEIACDIIVDDFTIYKDNLLFEEFPLPYGNSGSYDVYLAGAATYTGYLHYPSGNFSQLFFTLQLTFETGISSSPVCMNPFRLFVQDGNTFLSCTSQSSCASQLVLYNEIGQLVWKCTPENTDHYLINISDHAISNGVYFLDACIDERRYQYKITAFR